MGHNILIKLTGFTKSITKALFTSKTNLYFELYQMYFAGLDSPYVVLEIFLNSLKKKRNKLNAGIL